MAISLYDISVSNYLQVLGGIAGVLEKGAEFAGESDQGVPLGKRDYLGTMRVGS